MKKIIIILLSFWAVLFVDGQEQNPEFPLFRGRIEATNFDQRGLIGFLHFTTSKMVVDMRGQLDGKNVYSISVGPVLSKHTHDKIRLSVMPGVAHNAISGETYYSGALFFKAEEIRGKEFYLYAKGMKTFKGNSATFLVEGDLMFNWGKTFKLGPSLSVETAKYKESESRGEEAVHYDGLFNLGVRSCFSPIGWKKISFTSFIGWGNESLDGKTRFGFFNDHTSKNYLIFEAGIQLSLSH